jgi:hypothetical protein
MKGGESKHRETSSYEGLRVTLHLFIYTACTLHVRRQHSFDSFQSMEWIGSRVDRPPPLLLLPGTWSTVIENGAAR